MGGWMDGCINCLLAVLVTMMTTVVAARTTRSTSRGQREPKGSGCACQMQASRKEKKSSSQVTQARDLPALCPAPKGRFEVPSTMQRPLSVTLNVGVDPGMRSKGPTQVENQIGPRSIWAVASSPACAVCTGRKDVVESLTRRPRAHQAAQDEIWRRHLGCAGQGHRCPPSASGAQC